MADDVAKGPWYMLGALEQQVRMFLISKTTEDLVRLDRMVSGPGRPRLLDDHGNRLDKPQKVAAYADAVALALKTNGGPILPEDTTDGRGYVMVRADAFEALEAAHREAER